MFMRSELRRHTPLPEWTPGDAGSTSGAGPSGGGAGVVSGNPAYPGSAIWTQGVWSSTGFTGSPSAGAGGQKQTYGNVTASVLFQQLGSVPADTMKAYQKKLVQANLLSSSSLSKGGPDDATMGAFAELFMLAIRTNQGRKPSDRLTWTELLDGLARAGKADDEAAYAAQHQPSTTTSQQTYLTGEDDADAYLTQAMTALLGRAPTKKEIANFTSKLNEREQANPSTTTTHNDGYGNTKSTTEASSVSPGAVAENFATSGKKREKEAGSMMIQQYTDALMSLGMGG